MMEQYNHRWRPYRVECTGSLPTSEDKRRRARLVLGWGTAREDLRVLPAFFVSNLVILPLNGTHTHTHTHTHTQAHTPFSITKGRGWYSNRGAHALWMLTPFCLLTPVRKTHRRCCRSICKSVPKHAPLIRKTNSMTPPNSSHVILQVYKEANHTPHTHSQHNHVNTPTLAHKKRRHPESNQARLVRRSAL